MLRSTEVPDTQQLTALLCTVIHILLELLSHSLSVGDAKCYVPLVLDQAANMRLLHLGEMSSSAYACQRCSAYPLSVQ